MRSLAFLILALVVSSLPPPAAGDGEPFALIAADSGEGNLWYAVRIPAGTRQGTMEAVVRAGDYDSDFFASRFYIFDAQGTYVSHHGLALYGPEYRAKLAIDGQTKFEVSVEHILYGGGASLTSKTQWGCDTCDPIPSDLYFVDVLAVENAVEWDYEVRSNDGGAWATEHGPSFVYTERSFEGLLTVQAVDATANLEASIPIANDASLLGFFYAGGWVQPTTHATTPAGDVTCPCDFTHATGDAAWGPGDYTFRLERNVGGGAMLHGASVRLPFPRP